MPLRMLPLSVLALGVGCSSLLGPTEREVVGIIEGLMTDAPGIEIPETVQVGEDFVAAIQTTWANGCARRGDTEVQADGATVTVTPYDVITEHGTCTQAPQQFTHTATLRFSEPGTAQIIVRGRASHDEGVRTVSREIAVR